MATFGKNIPGREKSKCQGPVVETCLNVSETARRLVWLAEHEQEKEQQKVISESIREPKHVQPYSPCKDLGFSSK